VYLGVPYAFNHISIIGVPYAFNHISIIYQKKFCSVVIVCKVASVPQAQIVEIGFRLWFVVGFSK
jgi:hypothetical protein